ncbi:MAG: ectonucleotide pyrophosphatase/phosphodiesterase [Bacteroidales bacterium]|nr:ectonucleotide pyrophosphatase/phosphodiesterase [Bacteroidales bacterium]
MKKWVVSVIFIVFAGVLILILLPKKQYVILVSMDAFRWDYHKLYSTPVLDDVAQRGVKAPSLIPVYPSKTFPNHYTLATGLYPDNHGLISNTFYDQDMQKLYRIGDRSAVENGDFYSGEPIWTTTEKNDIIAASMFWVGSEAPINGHQPTYWNSYDGSVPFKARVDSVINWLSLPKKVRPGFITLYFQEPDGVSHSFGPQSRQTDSVVTVLDGVIGDLISRVGELPIAKRVNIIIVSDHGMGEVSSERVVNLRSHIPEDLVEFYTGSNPSYLIDPYDQYLDSVLFLLNAIPHVKAYSSETMPEHYHYGKNKRFPGIVAEADSGWSIIASNRSGYGMRSKGAHGYDPSNTDMHGIFYALGPVFKKGFESDQLYNTDVYNIVCRILKIDPAPNDGDKERIENIFK